MTDSYVDQLTLELRRRVVCGHPVTEGRGLTPHRGLPDGVWFPYGVAAT